MPTHRKTSRTAKPRRSTHDALSGGELGRKGNPFYMRVLRSTFRFSIARENATGDGDTEVQYQGGRLINGVDEFAGIMETGQALGLKHLKDPDKNPIDMVFLLAANQRQNKTLLVTDIQINWVEGAAEVGVRIRAQMTNTTTNDLEK